MRFKRELHLVLYALAFVCVLDVARARPSEAVDPLELLEYTDWEASERQDDAEDEGDDSEGTFGSWWSERRPCSCANSRCGCCTGRLFPLPPWLRPRVCTNLTYIEDEFAVKMAVTFNDVVMYRNKLSGRNPPPVCLSPPRIPRAQVCIKLENVYLVERNIHACMAVEGLFNKQVLFGRTLGCMRMGSNGFAVVNPEDGGGLPTDAIDPDDDDEPNDEDDYDQVDEEDYDPVDEDNTVESGAADTEDQVAVEAQAPVETTTAGGNKKKGSNNNKVGASQMIIKPFIKGKDDSKGSVKTAGVDSATQGVSKTKDTEGNKAETSPVSDKQTDQAIDIPKYPVKTAGVVTVALEASNTKVTDVSKAETSPVNNKQADQAIESTKGSVKKAGVGTAALEASETKITDLNKAETSPVSNKQVVQVLESSKGSVKTAVADEGLKTTDSNGSAESNVKTSANQNEVVGSQAVSVATEAEASTTSSTTIDGLSNTELTQEDTAVNQKTTTESGVTVVSEEDKYSEEITNMTESRHDADELRKGNATQELIEQANVSENQSETKGDEKVGVEEAKGSAEEKSNAGNLYPRFVPENGESPRDSRGLMDDEIVGIGTVEEL